MSSSWSLNEKVTAGPCIGILDHRLAVARGFAGRTNEKGVG